MAERREQGAGTISTRERWAYRVAFAAFALFMAFGVYLLWYPTDFLSDLYAVLLLVTLGLGLISGLIAIYASPPPGGDAQQGGPPLG